MRRFALLLLAVPFLMPFVAIAAGGTLFVTPETGVYTIGEIFDIKVRADTGGEKINAAEAELTFNPDTLEVQKIITNDSILESWPTPPTFSNQKGTIRFSGWTKTNYVGSDGLLVTITFKALRTQTSNAYLAAGAILAADGKGSNIITSMKSGFYSVEPKHLGVEPLPELSTASDTPATIDELTKVQTGPEAPVFSAHSLSIDAGERIIASGKATPDSKVLFFLARGNEPEKYTAITSESDGSFTFISEPTQAEGVYRLRAAVQDINGTISPSERMTITVRSKGIAASAAVGAEVASTLLPILTLLVVGGLGAGYLLHLHSIEKMKRSEKRRK